jgi:hypothetical protein
LIFNEEYNILYSAGYDGRVLLWRIEKGIILKEF